MINLGGYDPSLTFGSSAYSDDAAGWDFGGGSASSFNTGADYNPATSLTGGITGWAASNQDAIEQARLGQAYPDNGKSYDWNAATLGITRLIDTAVKGYTVVKGAQAASYAGQNGLTYTNGAGRVVSVGGGNVLPLLLIGGLVLFLVTQKG